MPEKKIKVELLSYSFNPYFSPEQIVGAAIRQCYSSAGAAELKEKIDKKMADRLIKQIISSGHLSTIEHANFTFAISGISRACSHQLVRHRIASYSQQSQRYVKPEEGFNFIVPPTIKANKEAYQKFLKHIKECNKLYGEFLKKKIPPEDARFVLPNAAETKIVVTMNARSLFNFFEKRLCNRAQWEIRRLAQEMYKLCLKKAPLIFKHAGPTCETQKICWEGKLSCGKWKKIKGAILKERK